MHKLQTFKMAHPIHYHYKRGGAGRILSFRVPHARPMPQAHAGSPRIITRFYCSCWQNRPFRWPRRYDLNSSLEMLPCIEAAIKQSTAIEFWRRRRRKPLVPGVSHVKKCDWLVKNMTEVDLKKLNDWLTTCHKMTGGGGVMTTSASTGVVYSAL